MKNTKNQVQIAGRLGTNPTIKLLGNEKKLAKFSVAVYSPFKKRSGEKVSNIVWYSVTAWGELADRAEELLHKGSQVTVSGTINFRTFMNKAGVRQTLTEITAEELSVPQLELELPQVA